jgi:cytidylate kinase
MLDQIVERQISWSHLRQRVQELPAEGRVSLGEHIGPFITVSRQHGSGGGALARRIGEALGWAVVDQEIVEHLSDRLHIDRHVLAMLDETRANWVRDVVADLMPVQIVDRDTYLTHLERVIKMLALHGRVVFVGRGAQHFLPRSRGLRLRVVAPDAYCRAELARRDGLSEDEAGRQAAERDAGRAELVHRYFGKRIDDPHLYDLVLNAASLDLETQVDIVLTACRRLQMTA